MNLLLAQRTARTLMDEHGLASWSFAWDNAKRRYGACNHTKRTIQMSKPLTAHREEEAVRQTLLHEIAHALTPGHGHDRVWLRKAREIGYTGGRCSTDEVPEVAETSRYVSICSRCAFQAPRYKAPKVGATYRHRGCSGTVTIVPRASLRVAADRMS